MNNLKSIWYIGAIGFLGLASCSTNYNALKGEPDNLYFMASDAKVATEFAVKNNNPESFESLKQITAEEYQQENFSAKNVNPEYLAKYRNDNPAADEGTVYFDDSEGTAEGRQGDINVYNDFRGNTGSGYNSWNMNPWMMSSMYSPWGGFYDPFWGPGFGFRPGLSLSLGLGFGSRYGFGYGSPWSYGYRMGGFYDPFYSPYYSPYYGYRGFYNRPIIVIPGGSENQRQIVRGARPSRGSALANSTRRVATPASSRANARREAVSRNAVTSTPSSRANRQSDFSRSESDYYNANARTARSASPVRRSVNSPAMSRSGSTSSRDAYSPSVRTNRSQAPANVSRGSATDSRSRYAAPSRSSSPSYNRSSSPRVERSSTPTRSTYSAPARTRSSSPSFSAPSRSSGSSGGAIRSSGGSSRRGN